jgi:hypothetical protein
MKKFLNIFFVTLGVTFFFILILIGYVYATNMFGIKTLFMSDANLSDKTNAEQSLDRNPLIPESQEKALQAIGVDPAKLPTKITPEMNACFEQKLGATRTLEIKNGSTPTATEFIKVQSCL